MVAAEADVWARVMGSCITRCLTLYHESVAGRLMPFGEWPGLGLHQ